MTEKIKNEILALCEKLGFKKDNDYELIAVKGENGYLLNTQDFSFSITDGIYNFNTIINASCENNGFKKLLNLIKILFNE